MKIIALSDLHDARKHLEPLWGKLAEVDLVILAGDLTNNGSAETTLAILQMIREHNPFILAVPGNWDGQEVKKTLEAEQVSIHRRHKVIDGIAFAGVGGSLISGNSPYELSEADFTRYLDQAVEGLDKKIPLVLVSHQPPYGTLTDKIWQDSHAGSKAVNMFIEKRRPLICFTGHIHEGRGIDYIGETQIINPGAIWKGCYAYAEIAEGQVACLEIRAI